MELLTKAIQLILSLSILVILHELGHFLSAKIFKIRVERFFLFFDPWFSPIKKKIGHTVYGLGWLPLGGYVKLAGMVDESLDREQLKRPVEPWEFRAKPAWQRLIVMIGGVVFNIILSILIFSFLSFSYGDYTHPMKNIKNGIEINELSYQLGLKNGDKILSVDHMKIGTFEELIKKIILGDSIEVERASGEVLSISLKGDKKRVFFDTKNNEATLPFSPRIPAHITSIEEGSLAQKAQLEKGDKIIKINSSPITFKDELLAHLDRYKNQDILLHVNRNGEILEKSIRLDDKGKLGVYLLDWRQLIEAEKKQYSLLKSFSIGTIKTWDVLTSQIKMFKNIFNPQTKAYKQVGSIFSIGKVFTSNWNWYIFWSLTATLSIWLAFVNILPIPSLDGGYVLFTLIELIRGKKLSEKVLERSIAFGFAVLGLLMLIVLGWDIFKSFL